MIAATIGEGILRRPSSTKRVSGQPRKRTARSWYRFSQNRLALFGAAFLAAIVVIALIAPLVAPYDPSYIDLNSREVAPGTSHFFGTDRLGRDTFSRALYGARVSLGVGLAAMTISTLVGILLGAVAGNAGGRTDAAIMRFVDVVLALPTFFLLVIAQSLFPASVLNVIVIIGLTSWMGTARIVRGQFLTLKNRGFVEAAKALGCSEGRVIFLHILPNVSSQIIVSFTLGVANAILVESALSFLGLGIPPYEASWGNMLMDGQISVLTGKWWIAFFPGLLILLSALSINFVGDGLQESMFN